MTNQGKCGHFDFRSVALCVSTLLLTVGQASAHEKWFHETQSYGLRWDLFFRPLPLALFGAVELLVGLWILFGIFPREIILIAWIPINLFPLGH